MQSTLHSVYNIHTCKVRIVLGGRIFVHLVVAAIAHKHTYVKRTIELALADFSELNMQSEAIVCNRSSVHLVDLQQTHTTVDCRQLGSC